MGEQKPGRPKVHDIAVSQYDDAAGYMREFRRLNAESRRRNIARNNARQAVARRVAALHPDEFDAFLAEELAKRGLA